MHISITANTSNAIISINVFKAALRDFTWVYSRIGEDLSVTTQQRYVNEVDPTGRKWLPNSPATIRAYRSKHGYKSGVKKILRDSGDLQDLMSWRIADKSLLFGPHSKTWGYAALMQLGTRRSPARPYLGITPQDIQFIESTTAEYIRMNWKANT